jgi:hypothetical protein
VTSSPPSVSSLCIKRGSLDDSQPLWASTAGYWGSFTYFRISRWLKTLLVPQIVIVSNGSAVGKQQTRDDSEASSSGIF